MPPRRVVTPENLSNDFLIDLDREDGPVGLNLDPAQFLRDPETGRIAPAVIPPERLGDLGDVEAFGPSDSQILAYDGESEKWVPITLPAGPTAGQIKTLYESNANTNAFTDAEKTKLSGLVSSHFVGTFVDLAALTSTHTSNAAGSYAFVDAGVGNTVLFYIWDESDEVWIAGSPDAPTAGQIKTLYESNANTNAFTNTEKAKLAGIDTGAQVNPTGAAIVSAIDANLGGTAWRSPSPPPTVTTKVASYVAVSGDLAAEQIILMDVASANTVTINSGLTGSYPLTIMQLGAGQTTIVAGGGVTIRNANGLKLRAQSSLATLMKLGSDDYVLVGDTST